jgi:hypothetical protein
MPRFTFSLSDTALRSLLVVSDSEMRYLYSVMELIAEDPTNLRLATWRDRFGRVTHAYRARQFEIVFRISENLPHIFFSDVRIA